MTTIESILTRLTKAVSGTDKELYTEEELTKFATFYLDKWDENTSEDVIAESFTDYWWDTDRTCRRCSKCGKLMREGYCVDMGPARKKPLESGFSVGMTRFELATPWSQTRYSTGLNYIPQSGCKGSLLM